MLDAQAEPRTVRTGMIVAGMTEAAGGVVFHAPLFFDEDAVAETGSWFRPVDAGDGEAVEDALADLYLELYPAWCAAREQERAAAKGNTRPRGPSVPVHTPCPALWAGR